MTGAEVQQLIRSKQAALDLAQKVQDVTGNDQNIEQIEKELSRAYQMYQEWVDLNTKEIKATEPSTVIRMTLTDLTTADGTPRWLVAQVNEDGSEKVLGVQ